MKPAVASAPAHVYVRIAEAGGARWQGFSAVDGRPDVLAAQEFRLPFADESVAAIYLDHVLERLDLAGGARLLQDCRRVLTRGGRIRVVTTDLGRILAQHASPEAWVAAGWHGNGYDWDQQRGHMLNRAFREAGRRWLYDLGEITRIGTLMGLHGAQRRDPGDSPDPRLAAHEAASETDLIVELEKAMRAESGIEAGAEGPRPLVSVLVPLYRTTFLRETVACVLDQTYDDFELVLCDDGPPGGAEPILRGFSRHPRFDRIRYFPNAERQGDARNYVACFKKARGAYIKFLNDDDLIASRCLEVMVACLRDHPRVSLVTSHRQIIDPEGRPLPDVSYSLRPVGRSAIISARSAIARMLAHQVNFIGEPSTVMFRKRDVESIAPNFWSLAGHNFVGNGDVTIWLNLLAQGDLLYLGESLSSFRRHPGQVSHDKEVIRLALIAWQRAADGAAELGLYTPGADATLQVRPLESIPWWPAALRARLDAVALRARAARAGNGGGGEVLAEVGALAAEATGAANIDPELVCRLAELRFAAGDLRGALDLAISTTRATPHHQPAHLLVARLLLALGDAVGAGNIFKETHAIYPLIRNQAGVIQAADGTHYLAPEARFRVEADLPDAVFTLQITARTTPGFRNLPIRLWAGVGTRGDDDSVSHAVNHADLTQDRQILTIALPLPHQTEPVEIRVSWRGSPERFLPGAVAPLSVQITGLDLSLAPPMRSGAARPWPDRTTAI
jgi:glycosyltransferase involved in cell wall biosynthesis/predicted SAM-dependent methyltransferase